MSNALRIFVIGGLISYRALFNWMRPAIYIPTMLVGPLFQILFFAYLGRAVPFVANGVLVSAFGLVAGGALLRFHPHAAAVPAIALTVVVSASACTAFGLALGAVAVRMRDVLIGANIAYVAMQLLCGVNVPLSALPPWLQAIGRGLPLTHGIEAARGLAAGASLSRVGGLVLTEAAVGVAWATAAFLLFRLFEVEARRRATLETV